MATDKETPEFLSTLTFLEAAELSKMLKKKMLEEKWGVSAAAPVAVDAVGNSIEQASTSDKEYFFEILLVDAGQKKINIIKEVCGINGLGLKEAKNLVDNQPSIVGRVDSQAHAEEVLGKLRAYGAKVQVTVGAGSVPAYVGDVDLVRGAEAVSDAVALVYGDRVQEVQNDRKTNNDETFELSVSEWNEAKLLAAQIIQRDRLGTLGKHLNYIKANSIQKAAQ